MSDKTPVELKGRMREITPELAARWLEGKVHNRKVRDSKVMEYAADMRSGRWRQTHQGIAFNEDHCLTDGQHRLYAVVEANVSVWMMVTEGVPAESMIAFDGGLVRTVTDVIQIDDPDASVQTLHVACGRAMMASTSAVLRTPTRQEVRDFLNKHWTPITFAVEAFGRKVPGVTLAHTIAVIARAHYTVKAEQLSRFCEVLRTGEMAAEAEAPIIKLRNWMMGVRSGVRSRGGSRSRVSGTGQSIASLYYGKTERALQAFLRGEKLGSLFPATEELFLLPEEQAQLDRLKKRRRAS